MQTIVLEQLKICPKVLVQRAAGNQMVVQVAEAERQIAKNMIHELLKRLRGVPQTEWHVHILIKAEWRQNRRFCNITRRHRSLSGASLRALACSG
jgi:hypothetical protein